MAIVEQRMSHTGGDYRSGPVAGRRHGRANLAEVIMIRPGRSHRSGLFGSLVTMARGFASPRIQATSVRPTPRRPSSPAFRLTADAHVPVPSLQLPDDAA